MGQRSELRTADLTPADKNVVRCRIVPVIKRIEQMDAPEATQ